MKRIGCLLLTALFLLSLAGCRASESHGAAVPETTDELPSVSEIPQESLEVTVPKETLGIGAGESDLVLGITGGVQVTYSGNISSARYITSRDQLPDYPELQGYDDAYFAEHGLLVVLETVTSGGITVAIGGVTLDGDNATVRLTHESKGDMGTAVMTTWLLWAEVEKGLGYTWSVGNPAVESESQKY